MDLGKLDRRITILRKTEGSTNAFNERSTTWPAWATFAASKVDVRDSERIKAQEIGASLSVRFQVRWSERTRTILPTDRVQYETRTYDIVGLKEIGRHDGIEITANVRAESALP